MPKYAANILFLLSVALLSSMAEARSSNSRQTVQSWHQKMGLRLSEHLAVEAVEPAQFAAVIGVQVSDVITALNSVAISTLADFERVAVAQMATQPKPWVLTVRRQRQTLKLTADDYYQCNPFTLIGCGELP